MKPFQFIPRHSQINGHATIAIGPQGTSQGCEIYLANPDDRSYADGESHIFAFGGHSCGVGSYVRAWGTFGDAFDIACEFVLDRWPGYSAAEACAEALAEYMEEHHPGQTMEDLADAARSAGWAASAADTMRVGGGGERMHSDDVHHVCSSPDRGDLINLCYPGGPDSWRHEAGDTYRAAPQYRPTARDHDPTFHERAATAAADAVRDAVDHACIEARQAGLLSEQGLNRIDRAMSGWCFQVGSTMFEGYRHDDNVRGYRGYRRV